MIVDSDAHITEPVEAFERFLEEPYRARRPRIIKDTLGLTRILLEGRLYPEPRLKQAGVRRPEGARPNGSDAGGADEGLERGVVGCRGRMEGVPAGAADPRARLDALDLEGIDVQVIYGNLGVALSALPDKDFAVAMSRACNNYYADFCRSDPGRLKCMAALPLQDVPSAVAEMTRAVKELGHAGAALPPNVNGKNLDHPDFYPLYETAERLGVPLGVHWGNGAYLTAAGAERFDTHFMTHAFGHPFEQMIAMTCVVCGGVVERFPRLRFAFLEAGCGWLPYWLERLHEHYRRRGDEVPLMKREPLEYVTSGSCYFGTEPEESMLPAVLRLIGDDYVLFGSDYPHSDSTFPRSVELLSGRTDISAEARRKVLGPNGVRFLGLEADAPAAGARQSTPAREARAPAAQKAPPV